VSYVQKETASEDVRKLYDGFETQFGVRGVPNVAKALANSPGLATRVFPLANYFMNQSLLDKRARELAVLMLMKRCDCEYGFVRHIEIAKREGISQQQIDEIGSYRNSRAFSDNDKLILQYAEELTTRARIDDELFNKVAEVVGKDKMVDLTGAIAFWNMMARNLNALQVGLES
jgi:alkylhydroperoxidase family enzyme